VIQAWVTFNEPRWVNFDERRRIEREIHIRRETAGLYLHAAGIPVRRRGGLASNWPPWPESTAEGAKPATIGEVITDSREGKPAIRNHDYWMIDYADLGW